MKYYRISTTSVISTNSYSQSDENYELPGRGIITNQQNGPPKPGFQKSLVTGIAEPIPAAKAVGVKNPSVDVLEMILQLVETEMLIKWVAARARELDECT